MNKKLFITLALFLVIIPIGVSYAVTLGDDGGTTIVPAGSSAIGTVTNVWDCSTGDCNTPTVESGETLSFNDDTNLEFGTSQDVQIRYDSAATNDSLQIGVTVGAAATSGFMSLMEKADLGNANRDPASTTTNPTFRVWSADATAATDFLEMSHDQTDAVMNIGSGALAITGGVVHVGDAGTESEVDGDGDLYVEDELEVDGQSHFLDRINSLSTTTALFLLDDASIAFGSAQDVSLQFDPDPDPDLLVLNLSSAGRTFILTDTTLTNEFSISNPANAELRIMANGANGGGITENEHIRFFHDQTNGNIASGLGSVIVTTPNGTVVLDGDIDQSNASPHQSMRDSTDDVAYQKHLDTSALYSHLTWWRGTDADGSSFLSNPNTPVMQLDTNNDFHIRHGMIIPQKVVSDPCSSGEPEGGIFYNDTGNFWCGCDGTNDIKLSDGSACF